MNYFETIKYDPGTGIFTWAIGRRGCSLGARAGSVTADGYLVIKLGRTPIRAHRLAWRISTGEWPDRAIDHINGDRLDNRIANLRAVDHSINMQNKRSAMVNNKSCGLLGVTWNKQHKRWQSKLVVGRRRYHVGYFSDPHVAHLAYVEAKRKLHPGCTI